MMRTPVQVLLCASLLLSACPGSSPPLPECDGEEPQSEDELRAAFAAEIQPLLERPATEGGCAGCHSPDSSHELIVWRGAPDRTFEGLWSAGHLQPSGSEGSMVDVLAEDATARMPLGAEPWPTEERNRLQRFTCALAVSGLTPPPPCPDEADPGFTAIRRLSAYEYEQTVGSALGADLAPPLPLDDAAFGFDTVGTVQQLSPTHLDFYARAGASLAAETLLEPEPLSGHFEAESLTAYLSQGSEVTSTGHGHSTDTYRHFQRIRSYVLTPALEVLHPGTYTVRIRARGWGAVDRSRASAEDEWEVHDAHASPQVRIELNGGSDLIATAAVPSLLGEWSEDWHELSWTAVLEPGQVRAAVWLDNAVFYSLAQRDVKLQLDWIQLEGPAPGELPEVDEERLARFLICAPSEPDCPSQSVENVLTTLWRRPATSEEVTRYSALMDETSSYKDGVQLVLEAALLSPYFLMRPELDEANTGPHPVSPYELATRLSYFLWSRPPDDILLEAAGDGSLLDDSVLRAQVDRLLADPRSTALADNFAGQWLELRSMETMTFNEDLFPEFDEELRAAMTAELRRMFDEALINERPLSDLLDSDRTWVNDRLAAHYGIPLPGSPEALVEVDVSDHPRGGVLESAGFLALSSHPARTSPTRRGRWILQQLLCLPPEEPPNNVETSIQPGDEPESLRELLAEHRENPACAACHATMDPLGLTFENFGPLGSWREVDDYGQAVDPSAQLPTGEQFADHRDAVEWIANRDELDSCMTQKMLLYALGRTPASVDRCALAEIEDELDSSGGTLGGLVRAVATSRLFRERRPLSDDELQELTGDR